MKFTCTDPVHFLDPCYFWCALCFLVQSLSYRRNEINRLNCRKSYSKLIRSCPSASYDVLISLIRKDRRETHWRIRSSQHKSLRLVQRIQRWQPVIVSMKPISYRTHPWQLPLRHPVVVWLPEEEEESPVPSRHHVSIHRSTQVWKHRICSSNDHRSILSPIHDERKN